MFNLFRPFSIFQKTYPKRIEMGSGILAIVSGGSNLMNVEPVKAWNVLEVGTTVLQKSQMVYYLILFWFIFFISNIFAKTDYYTTPTTVLLLKLCFCWYWKLHMGTFVIMSLERTQLYFTFITLKNVCPFYRNSSKACQRRKRKLPKSYFCSELFLFIFLCRGSSLE